MKRVLFLSSHPGAAAEQLATSLQCDQHIQFYENDFVYNHPSDITTLYFSPHKNTTTAAIYAALLLDNSCLSGRALYKFCHFIYFIRNPKFTITELVNNKVCDLKSAIDLYVIRIRRLYEMAVQTPEAVFLTWDNLKDKKGLDLIENYLLLKSPLEYPDLTEPKDCILSSYLQEAEEAYEGIIYRTKQLKHISQCQ